MTFTQILAESRRLVKANSTSYSTPDITTSANRAIDRIVSIIRDSEGRWQWDDSNQTDLPSATTSAVANQQDYSLSTAHLKILRVEIKDEDGIWHKLQPIDQADLFDSSITEFLSTAGTPQYYDKQGTSLLMYPKFSYSQAASIRVFHERGASYFTSADTSKEPGFNSMFHSLVPMWCAYDYALINSLPILPTLRNEINITEEKLKDHYGTADKDERNIRITSKGARYQFN
jgi:hypothetical protein